MKRFLIPGLVLILTQLACEFVMGAFVPTATPLSTQVSRSTAISSLTPEQINSGTHQYLLETIEAGCAASEDSKGTTYVEKTLTFSPDFTSVVYADRVYQQTGTHRYESKNESNRPLVLIFSEIGFDLEVYNPGEDTKATPACLTFRFQLVP